MDFKTVDNDRQKKRDSEYTVRHLGARHCVVIFVFDFIMNYLEYKGQLFKTAQIWHNLALEIIIIQCHSSQYSIILSSKTVSNLATMFYTRFLTAVVAGLLGAQGALAVKHGEISEFDGKTVRWQELAKGVFTGVPENEWDDKRKKTASRYNPL